MSIKKIADERIQLLRNLMEERGIDYYVVPTSDYHESEYVGEYFKARNYISGFTGSSGTAVIGRSEAGLWTDGRYFIQAQAQLEGSCVTLFRMAEENVPTIEEFLKEQLPEGGCIGFDGRVMNTTTAGKYEAVADEKKGSLFVSEDLIGMIWNDRPSLPDTKAFLLESEYTGRSTEDKLADVRAEMKESGADVHILASLYDIAWLLNVRGGDIEHVPVILSFLVLTQENCFWFVRDEILEDDIRKALTDSQITLCPYDEIYSYVSGLDANTKVMLDKGKVNYQIVSSIPEQVEIKDLQNPTEKLKAVKNPVELQNTVEAHIKDGVAFTKFMYWLKQNAGKLEMTEITASDYLAKLRSEQEHFLDLSFETICGYGPNGAMMHYAATEDSAAVIKPEGFLLVDSGGHYLEGTTDITRTIAVGPVTAKMKEHFTAVCCSNLNLADVKFLYGCAGQGLDIIAREPLWELGIDYKCGTGHGVGHILNVHEGPNSFRWKYREDKKPEAVLEEGMITTDEPGVYLEGEYGIRIENELICRKWLKNEYGQFMCFENITYAPIDLDAIDPEQMSRKERQRLNEYHKMVYDTLSPRLNDDIRNWLKDYTRAI